MGGHRRIIGAAAVLLLAACGKGPGTGAGPYGAADAATAEVPADRTGMPDAELRPGADLLPDSPADGGCDAAGDLLADRGPSDPATDPLPDTGPDLPSDAAPDAAPEIPGELPPVPCGPGPYEGTVAGLWDLPLLLAPATLDLEILGTWTEGFPPVQVREIRYTSYQVEDCVLSPIRIEAFVARPLTGSGFPGLVVAHGLGGSGSAGAAAGPAQDLGVVALAYSGPGQGQSEGTGCGPDHLFDTVFDPRASWFWEHATAAMRGLTVLETLPEADPARLGMTGYSGGGVVTLMVNGVDPRVKAAVPVAACGHLDLAAAATPVPGWEVNLLAAMTPPRTPASPEFQAFMAYLDPKNYGATAFGGTLIIDGAQDEFFPIHSLTATFDSLGGAAAGHRLLAIKDWDHGPLAMLLGTEEAEEMLAATGNAWLRRVFGLSSAVAELPPMPELALQPWTCFDPGTWLTWPCALAAVTFSTPTGYDVEEVQVHWSADGSLTYLSWDLEDQGGGIWAAEVQVLDGTAAAGMVSFAEVRFHGGGLLGPDLWLTSRPHIPEGFSPNVLPMPQ